MGPTCSRLIYGQHDAVLVDNQLTTQAAGELTEWVAETGKNLTAIYITHSHGDHHFGSAIVRRRFPKAKILAKPGVASRMANGSSSERVSSLWEKLFPDQIPSDFASTEALSTNVHPWSCAAL